MGGSKKTLIVLALVWVAILVYNRVGQDSPPASPAEKVAEGSGRGAAPAAVPELRLDLLDRPAPDYTGVKKDIFRPLKAPVARAAVKKAPEPVAPAVAAPPPPPPPPTLLEKFVSSLKFLGFLEKKRDKTIFLGSGEDVFLARSGDIIGARFRVTGITDTALRLTDEVTGEEATLDLPI